MYRAPLAMCIWPTLRSCPALSRRPSEVTTASPAYAAMVPALRTPTPVSLPTSVILPACAEFATSIDPDVAAGAASTARACVLSLLTTLAPPVTASSAQIPALIEMVRAMRSA